ncbi:ammonia-dependent NAD(+) synthetase [Leuconostoc palmae]|uniref:ammonia-dependent NAD(+) synthetase n=1 Tax=Leuconostoc palmae TaxID=501487 RepID=UPI001C7D9445|nr:ammonia-dependent NAD(+) synthetase [Leuconostoc palmae]
MRTLQSQIIANLKVQPSINPLFEIERSVNLLKQYLLHNPQYQTYVIAISGGQDSTLAGKLAKIAIEELNASHDESLYQLIAVRQPYGEQLDEADAQEALTFINPDIILTTNIKAATDAMTSSLRESGLIVNDMSKGSIKPKVRMIAQYAIAREHNGVVIGTDHASEAFAGFFTKYGDGGTDINPLWRLNKRQGRQMLVALQAPKTLYEKIPTADLEDKHPLLADETALGVTYNEIDDYLEGKSVEESVANKIESLYLNSEHKRHEPINVYDTWFY